MLQGMDQRKFCFVHRLRVGLSDEQGVWIRNGGRLAVFLINDESGTHFQYPDVASMRREGWIDNPPAAA